MRFFQRGSSGLYRFAITWNQGSDDRPDYTTTRVNDAAMATALAEELAANPRVTFVQVEHPEGSGVWFRPRPGQPWQPYVRSSR